MKVNPVGKRLSEIERAYIAGFLDADGAIMATIERHQEKKFGFRVRVVLKITQKDRKILDWLNSTFCAGHVNQNRTTFDWVVRDQKHIKEILYQLIPHIRVKKQQAQHAIDILSRLMSKREEIIEVARLADTLAALNVRSKNRRLNFVSMIEDNKLP